MMPDKTDLINKMEEILRALVGDRLDEEGMIDTPRRAIEALIELTRGYGRTPAGIIKTFPAGGYDEMVILKDIGFASLCEHHLLPFYGTITIAYLPRDRLVGVSKLARVAKCFSERLQVQERLTVQIADALMEHLAPKGVGVWIKAEHHCMKFRGVKNGGTLVTMALRGAFQEAETRKEFLRLCT